MLVQQLLKQAQQHHSSGDLARAAELYEQVLEVRPFDAAIQHSLGVLAYQVQNYQLADELISKAINARSKADSVYLLHLGLVRLAKKDYQSAEELLTEASQLEPQNPDIAAALGNCFLAMQNLAEAEKYCRAAVALSSMATTVEKSVITAMNNLGFILLKRGQLVEAKQILKKAVETAPDFNTYLNLGTCYAKEGDNSHAVECFKAAEQLVTESIELLAQLAIRTRDLGLDLFAARLFSQLGILFHQASRLSEAEQAFKMSCTLDGTQPKYFVNMATFFADVDKFEEAQQTFSHALDTFKFENEAALDLIYNYCLFLSRVGALNKAESYLQEAMVQWPNAPTILTGLAHINGLQNRNEEAIDYYNRAIDNGVGDFDLSPLFYDRALIKLRVGDFASAWQDYRHRIYDEIGMRYLPDPANPAEALPLPERLDKDSLSGKHFCLLKEQGLGDQLFFLRFAQWFKQYGVKLTVCVDAKLSEILARTKLFDLVVDSDMFNYQDISNDVDNFYYMGDMPLLTGHGSENDTGNQSPPPLALRADTFHLANIQKRLDACGEGPLLGITWRAGTQRRAGGPLTLSKEFAVTDLINLINGWSGQVIVLQRQVEPGELDELRDRLDSPSKLHDFSDVNDNLEEMLALLEKIDTYVGVSNTNMHLFAGLQELEPSKRACVMVPSPAEWRWMTEKKSVWFHRANLYRQSPDGDWYSAITALERDLLVAS